MIPFISRETPSNEHLWIQQLSSALPEETIVRLEQMSDAQKFACDVAIVANPDPKDLLLLPNLRWVHSVWAGVEGMVKELNGASFSIARLIDPQLTATMTEAVLAWTLYLHRGMPVYAQQQRDKIWQAKPMVRPQDCRISILGLGTLGQASALRLVENGFNVSGWSRTGKVIEGVNCYFGVQGLNELLAQTDIVVCLLPLTNETQGILNQDTLEQLPKGAQIINFARGPIIDAAALIAALNSNHIGHAVLDVFAQEPLPKDDPFWCHANVTVLPHISAQTNTLTASQIVASAIRRYRDTGKLPEMVDMNLGY